VFSFCKIQYIKAKIIKICNFASDMKNVLYIHGMGGGSDSRIPSILSEYISVVTRTYSFDPDVAAEQISSWVDELKPVLVIGESLGALHALESGEFLISLFPQP
jgi:pimeloyl-ACP methyl ester carboxylesterase